MESDRVAGVQLESGQVVKARNAVITTCNPVITLNQLLPEGVLDSRLSARARDIPIRKTHATSLKINVAINGGEVSMPRHEKWRGDGLDLRKYLVAWHTLDEQDAGWNALVRGEWPDPVPVSCAIIPSAVDPTQAPPGRSNLWLWSGVIPVTPAEPWGRRT